MSISAEIREHVRSFGEAEFTTADVTACRRFKPGHVQSTVKRMRREGVITDVGVVYGSKNALIYINVSKPGAVLEWQFGPLLNCFPTVDKERRVWI